MFTQISNPLKFSPLIIVGVIGVVITILSLIYILVFGVGKSQSPLPSSASEFQRIEDTDPKFDYGGNNPNRPGYPFWDLHQESGDYVLSGDFAHACRTDINLGCVAKLDLKSHSTPFNKIQLGFTTGKNRTSADIYIDGQKIAEVDSNSQTTITNFNNYSLWSSPAFSCGNHEIKIIPNGRTGTNAKSFDLDFVTIQPCTMQTPPPNPAPPTQDRANCQGNSNPSVKCFSCRKDSPTDQVNIFDFSCFSRWYGNNVGVAPSPTPSPSPSPSPTPPPPSSPGGVEAQIIPIPQKLTWDNSTSFKFNSDTKIVSLDSSPEGQKSTVALARYINVATGLNLPVLTSPPSDLTNTVILGQATNSQLSSQLNTFSSLANQGSKPEGYLLGINSKMIVLGGFDGPGTWYAVQTLRQMLEQGKNTLKGVGVYDYPDISYRAAHFRINQDPPKQRVIKLFAKFVENVLSRGKYNAMHIFFQGKDYGWTSNTTCVQSASITPAEMKELIAVASNNFIEIVPERFPVEEQNCTPGGRHAFCVDTMWSKQKSYIDEQLALYKPKHFNILLDTAETNLNECGTDGKAQFAKGVTTVSNYLTSKGVQPLTWAQGIAGAGILNSIPKNVGMLYWDYDQNPKTAVLSQYQNAGFKAYGAPAVKYESPPIFKNLLNMTKAVKQKNASGVVVTTWTYFSVENWNDASYALPKLGGLIVGGDYAWNTSSAAIPVTYNPNQIVLNAMK